MLLGQRSWENRQEDGSCVALQTRKGAAKGLLSPLGRHVPQEGQQERGVFFRLPIDILFVEKGVNQFNASLFRRWLVLFAPIQVIKNGNTKNEVNFPESHSISN